jgi:demethylmenaquinone methyltransferase/2-methoxy-6-polyprenyl-1,4-benzoquinol methylase
MSTHIDVERVKRKYRWNVLVYDSLVQRPTARLRARAVERLTLQRGETVLDFGCGTGLSFALLERAVGSEGRIVAVDVSPDMLAVANSKIVENAWNNCETIEADVESAPLTLESVDAVLCFYTHDIITSPRAVDVALGALRPGGRFVAAGVKLAGGLRGTIRNPLTLAVSFPAITHLADLDRPWALLETRLGGLEIEEHLWGTAYLARGIKESGTGAGVRER